MVYFFIEVKNDTRSPAPCLILDIKKVIELITWKSYHSTKDKLLVDFPLAFSDFIDVAR